MKTLNEKKMSEILESMKKTYFKDVPEEVADALIRRFVYTLLAR
jgi:hypothetical protein